jgi:hypothetical protein
VIVLDDKGVEELVGRIADAVIQRLGNAGGGSDGQLSLREPEAAKRLGIPQHRLKAARLRGEVAAVRVGRSFLYPISSLQRMLQQKE